VQTALKANDAGIGILFNFVPADIVEFGEGVPDLISIPETIKSDWDRLNPGNVLLYGAIASAAAVDQTLALFRLGRVEGVVGSQMNDDTISETLAVFPSALATPGTDGVIVLITATPATEPHTVCHTVARLKPGQSIESFKKSATLGDFPAFFNSVVDSSGNVSFDQGTDTVAGDSLTPVANTLKAKGGTPMNAVVVSLSGDSTNAATYAAQAARIMSALKPPGTDAITAVPFPIQATSLVPCPAITVIEFSQPASSGGCITPAEVVIFAPPIGAGGEVPVRSATVRITNNSAADFSILSLRTVAPFSVIMPDNKIVPSNGGFVDVTVNYTRVRQDTMDDTEHLTISISTNALCPPPMLIGRLQETIVTGGVSADVVVANTSSPQVQPKIDVPVTTNTITKAETTRGRAKPAAPRKPRKK
jgi:hypothetical protein